MAWTWAVGIAVLTVLIAFAIGRVGALALLRADCDRAQARRVVRRATIVTVPNGGLVVAVAVLPDVAVGPLSIGLPELGPIPLAGSLLYGTVIGVATAAVAAAVSRGFRPLRRTFVDETDRTHSVRDLLQWWIARLVPLIVAASAAVLLVREWYPLGLAGVLVTWVFCFVAFQFLRRPRSTATRRRDPTPEERERIEAVLGDHSGVPDGIVVLNGTSEWPVGWIRRPSSEVLHVDEDFLGAVDDQRLGAALTQAAVAGRRQLGLLQILTWAWTVTSVLLAVALLAFATVVDAPNGPGAVLYAPVTLTVATVGALTTAYVSARAARATVYAADVAAAERHGVEAVDVLLEEYGNAVPVEQLTPGNLAEGGVHSPTAGQRRRVLADFSSPRSEAATRTGSLPGASDARHSATRFLATEGTRVGAAWALFGLAAAIHWFAPAGAVGLDESVARVATDALVATGFAIGYLVLVAGRPVLNLPMTLGEYPFHPRELRFKQVVDPALGVVLLLTADRIAAGSLNVLWLVLVPPLFLAIVHSSTTVPFTLPKESLRAPTDAERTAVEEAYERFDRDPDAVVAYESDADIGDLYSVRGLGTTTVYLNPSLLDEVDDTELAVALAHADERARGYWYQRAFVLPLGILVAGLAGLLALFEGPPPLVTTLALLSALLCIPVALVALRLARRPVYRADSYAASVFGAERVRTVLETHGERLRQIGARTDRGPDERGLYVSILSQEPPVDQRLDRLSESES